MLGGMHAANLPQVSRNSRRASLRSSLTVPPRDDQKQEEEAVKQLEAVARMLRLCQ